VGYYTNWAQYRPSVGRFLPEDVNASLYTHLCYAFAIVGADYKIKAFEWNDILSYTDGMYKRFHTHVRAQNPAIKTLISIGGWTFNEKPSTKLIFTQLAATSNRRATFIASCIIFARTHGFDGIDLDWEYPGHVAQGGRTIDKVNFVKLMQDFRAAIVAEALASGQDELLFTLAVAAGASTITAGYDIANIHPYVDWIGVMTYDLHGAWEASTGLHTTLYGTPSVSNGLQLWHNGGTPKSKLVVGLASYGRGWTLTSSTPGQGLGAAASGACTQGAFTGTAGFVAYYEIQTMIANGGVVTSYPDGSNSVQLGNQWIGFDTPAEIRRKVSWIKAQEFSGAMIWSLALDNFKDGNSIAQAMNV
jgi:chitinase